MGNVTPAALFAVLNGDFDEFFTASMPGGIEAQEAAGQQWLVEEEVLPVDCPRADLESLGFTFGEVQTQDAIFVPVKFPVGWRKEATDNLLLTNLIDSNGNIRGSIFYKAAFYDRRTNLHLLQRYCVSDVCEHDHSTDKEYIQFIVCDNQTKTSIHETERVVCNSPHAWGEIYSTKLQEAREWLESHYPDSLNVLAYWD